MKKIKILFLMLSFFLIGGLSYGNIVGFTHASSTTTSTTTKVPYQEKLDAFLVKVGSMRGQLDDTKYENLLISIEKQLGVFSQKYTSNATLTKMIVYLKDGVKKLQYELNGDINVDNFLCQLMGNCESSVGCTQEYAPVCAQPPMPPCSNDPYIACMQVMPQPKTYSNSCMAGLDKASILYSGECKTTSSTSSSSTSSSSSSGGSSQSCSGTLPPSGAGVNVRPFTNIVAGPDTNTTWKYSTSGERCTWSCKIGYTLNAAKNNCETKSAGSGITVYVYDNITKQPLSGVGVDIIGIIGMSSSVIGSYTTDTNGKTQEDFSPASGMGNILQIKKSGYSIANASGCTPRVTRGDVYCDSIKMENSVVKIYLQNGSISTPTSKVGNSMSNLGSSACTNQTFYVVTDGVDKTNPPKGCARLAGTSACTTPADFRDYKADEWSGNNRIISTGQANQFPVGNYEFFALYGTQIVSAGSASLINCSTPSPNSCKWQYHAVFGPVGPLDINPNTTSCTSSLNGRSAYEVSGSKQKVATCSCN